MEVANDLRLPRWRTPRKSAAILVEGSERRRDDRLHMRGIMVHCRVRSALRRFDGDIERPEDGLLRMLGIVARRRVRSGRRPSGADSGPPRGGHARMRGRVLHCRLPAGAPRFDEGEERNSSSPRSAASQTARSVAQGYSFSFLCRQDGGMDLERMALELGQEWERRRAGSLRPRSGRIIACGRSAPWSKIPAMSRFDWQGGSFGCRSGPSWRRFSVPAFVAGLRAVRTQYRRWLWHTH